MDYRFVDQDPVHPTAIEHKCDEIFLGSKLEQRYNYIVYHFEGDGTYLWARTYTDDIKTVSLHGPFESRANMKPVGGVAHQGILAYLRRRFEHVTMLRDNGYASI